MALDHEIGSLKTKTKQKFSSEDFLILNLNKNSDLKKFNQLVKNSVEIFDALDSLFVELYQIRFPSDRNKSPEAAEKLKADIIREKDQTYFGNWIYYSWSNKLVHFPPENIWEEIRTARNKTLISAEEQKKFWDFNLGIVGLSVGQSTALTVTRSGGCKNLKLADPDTLDPTNLNRLTGDLSNCGINKATLVAQKIWELDPYYNLSLYHDGVTKENIGDFFEKDFKLDAIVDAADQIPMKIALRLEAKKRRIPVLMATDVADGVLVDIERYDLDHEKAIFGGRIEEKIEVKNKMDFIRAGLKIISPEYITLPLNEAMKKVGTEITTHPQLGSSAILCGTVLAYIIKKLSLGTKFPSERTHLDLEQYFDPKVKTKEYKELSKKANEELIQMLGI